MIKKQWRTTIILSAVLVALLAVWLVSSLIPENTPEETTITTNDLPLVFQADKEDVAGIDLVNPTGSYTLLPVEVRDDDGQKSIEWTVEGMDSELLSSSALNNLVISCLTLYGGKEIETDETDLSLFGLANPDTTVTIRLENGESHQIALGKELPSGYFKYAMLDNTGVIYSVASSTIANFQQSIIDLLDSDNIIGIEDEALTGMTFARARDDLFISADCVYSEQSDGSGTTAFYAFDLHKPIEINANSTDLTVLVQEIMKMGVNSFVELNPQDISAYGLDNPAYTVELVTADRSVTVKIGAETGDGSYYAISSEMDAVYTVKTSAFTKLDMPLLEMIDTLFNLKSIWLVDSFSFEMGDTAFESTVALDKGQDNADESAIFMLDGKDAKIFSENNKNLYTRFYMRVIGLKIAGIDALAQPVYEPAGRLVFNMAADTENDVPAYTEVIEFVERDDYTYYVFIDSEYTGYYLNAEEAFTSNKTDQEGVLVAYRKLLYAMEHAVDGVFNTQEGYQLD